MDCHLETGELVRLEGGREGIVLHCLKGTIWLTIGDGVDRLIHHGDDFSLSAGATAVAEALGASQMRLEARPRKAAAMPMPIRHTCRA